MDRGRGVSDEQARADADALTDVTGHRFRDPLLAATALSHASYAHESGGESNERLEFLGDAVLDVVISQQLFDAHPDWSEGQLSRARSALVSKTALAERARALGLGGFLKLGRAEQRAGGREKDSILADCFEAVIAALFLDGGLEPVAALVRRVFGAGIRVGPVRDAKTAFQEWAHATRRVTPSYETVRDTGVENDDHRFTVEVRVDGETWGSGVGRTKRAAEQSAARAGLERSADQP
jgi:ribonuclease-3